MPRVIRKTASSDNRADQEQVDAKESEKISFGRFLYLPLKSEQLCGVMLLCFVAGAMLGFVVMFLIFHKI